MSFKDDITTSDTPSDTSITNRYCTAQCIMHLTACRVQEDYCIGYALGGGADIRHAGMTKVGTAGLDRRLGEGDGNEGTAIQVFYQPFHRVSCRV
jgi:hypothetical protein